jgi:hypothetical protein
MKQTDRVLLFSAEDLIEITLQNLRGWVGRTWTPEVVQKEASTFVRFAETGESLNQLQREIMVGATHERILRQIVGGDILALRGMKKLLRFRGQVLAAFNRMITRHEHDDRNHSQTT